MKQSFPLVSVIIPTYNRAWILLEAIESVLVQDYPNFEVVLVDDGSTDNTPSILLKYGNDIRVIRQENRGVSSARNTGIRASSGELIAFLDSDDRWLQGKLSAQVSFFRSHPRSMICQTEEIWIRNGIRVNPKKKHQKRSGDIFEPSLHLCLISPSAVMARRELLDHIGYFDESLPACEDYDLWLRVAASTPVDLIETPLIIKRGGHEDQLSKQPGLDRFRIQSLVKLLQSKILSASQTTAALTVLKTKCRIYAEGCLKRGKSDEAQHYFHVMNQYADG